MKRTLLIFLLLWNVANAQFAYPQFTWEDSARGYLSPERAAMDVVYYHLDLTVNIKDKSINGSNLIRFKALKELKSIQLDLHSNMQIKRILYRNRPVVFRHNKNAVFVKLDEPVRKNKVAELTVFYSGKPQVNKNPPWAGGFVWAKDPDGADWVTVACEGAGASLWWPLKDHLSDEPDSMSISIAVPDTLMCVSNGRLRGTENLRGGFKRYTWVVGYPINSYNVTLNIARYANFTDWYVNDQGDSLHLDYYVLRDNVGKARKHFEQVKPMLKAFEHYFGKYPFWNDGYAMVETSYWGMEHQGAIAYGNKYKNNSNGFDFIIVHESAHEYWGNSISTADHAELWIHESFGTYAEALYVEFLDGKQKAIKYINKNKDRVKNTQPIVGPLNVNYHVGQDADMYYKGSLMLNTLRHVFNNDEQWFKAIKDLATQQAISIQNTENIIYHFSKYTEEDVKPVFEQYLYHEDIPKLVLMLTEKGNDLVVRYKWKADVEEFNMPVEVSVIKGEMGRITPSSEWQEFTIKKMGIGNFKVATDKFYIKVI